MGRDHPLAAFEKRQAKGVGPWRGGLSISEQRKSLNFTALNSVRIALASIIGNHRFLVDVYQCQMVRISGVANP